MRSFEDIKNSYRITVIEEGDDGFVGVITFPKWQGTIVVSNGGGWDHVSVAPFRRSYVPTWEDMCAVKDICFCDEESVIQIHPPKSQYVNNMGNCLHLWKPNDRELPLPPSILVGVRDGQTRAEIEEEIRMISDDNV